MKRPNILICSVALDCCFIPFMPNSSRMVAAMSFLTYRPARSPSCADWEGGKRSSMSGLRVRLATSISIACFAKLRRNLSLAASLPTLYTVRTAFSNGSVTSPNRVRSGASKSFLFSRRFTSLRMVFIAPNSLASAAWSSRVVRY